MTYQAKQRMLKVGVTLLLLVAAVSSIGLSIVIKDREKIRPDKAYADSVRQAEADIARIGKILKVNFMLTDHQALTFSRPIYTYTKKHKVEWELVAAIIYYESTYSTSAYNSASGASGAMQVLPSTADLFLDTLNMKKKTVKLLDLYTNIELGTAVIADNLRRLSLDSAIKAYVGDETGTAEAIRYRGGVKCDYERLKLFR